VKRFIVFTGSKFKYFEQCLTHPNTKDITLMRDLRVEDEPSHDGASHYGHYINFLTDFDSSCSFCALCGSNKSTRLH
jgi:hypothetical protein